MSADGPVSLEHLLLGIAAHMRLAGKAAEEANEVAASNHISAAAEMLADAVGHISGDNLALDTMLAYMAAEVLEDRLVRAVEEDVELADAEAQLAASPADGFPTNSPGGSA